jgi:hypothetical protein
MTSGYYGFGALADGDHIGGHLGFVRKTNNKTCKLACIAERIKGTLNHLIHEYQKSVIPGHCIGESIRIIYDIIFDL